MVLDTLLESHSALAPEDRELVHSYVATVPDARGRGIGTAITLHPLGEARALGYRAGILQSTPAATHLYRRLGFRELCSVALYVRH